MGELPKDEPEEEVVEVLTAGQALFLVAIIGGLALFYGYRWWKRIEEERKADSFLEYDFSLPEEKEEMQRVVAAKPEDKRENAPQLRSWHLTLCQLLMKRVLKVIDIHERVQNDYRTQSTLYKKGVAVYMLPQIEAAMKQVEREVQECGAIANQLKPQWGATIFKDAYKLREAQQKKLEQEAEKAEAEREKQLEQEAMRLVKREKEEKMKQEQKKAEEELLAEEDAKKKEGKKSK